MGEDVAFEFDTVGVNTGLRLHAGEDWDVLPDLKPDPADEDDGVRMVYVRTAPTRYGFQVPVARLRRIGWLDQRGRVWLKVPSTRRAGELGCGSFTPLLIDARE